MAMTVMLASVFMAWACAAGCGVATWRLRVALTRLRHSLEELRMAAYHTQAERDALLQILTRVGWTAEIHWEDTGPDSETLRVDVTQIPAAAQKPAVTH